MKDRRWEQLMTRPPHLHVCRLRVQKTEIETTGTDAMGQLGTAPSTKKKKGFVDFEGIRQPLHALPLPVKLDLTIDTNRRNNSNLD